MTDPSPGLRVRVPRSREGNRCRGQVGTIASVHFNEVKRRWVVWVRLPDDGRGWDGQLQPLGWGDVEVVDG